MASFVLSVNGAKRPRSRRSLWRRPSVLSSSFITSLAVLLIAVATLWSTPAEARYAAIVVDAETGQVLHEANADKRLYPASLTKIMTLYSVFDALEEGRLSLSTQLPVSRRAEGMPPSKIGVRAGTTISVEDAVLGLVTRSGNDAAVVLAEALGGTEFQFALDMTARAQELGLRNTQFRNASGLPDRGQVSTARDMATLARRLLEDHPEYYHYFSTRNFTYRGTTHRNHNNLLQRYEGADGIKTGYIRASGFNLVASVERSGSRIIAVVFGGRTAKSRDDHMITLLDRGFARLEEMRPMMVAITPPPHKPSDLFPTMVAGREDEVSVQTAGLEQGSATDRAAEDGGLGGEVSYAAGPAGGAWSIQVGAFRDEEPAHAVAVSAASRLSTSVEAAEVAIMRTAGQSGQLYRARLVGFTEAAAQSACRELARSGTDCLVVQPSDNLSVASN